MKKILTILILFTTFLVSASAKDVNISLSSHASGNAVILHGSPAVGGSVDIGLNFDDLYISTFIRYEHLFKPLGSSSGKLAMAEEMTELGLAFKLKAYDLGGLKINVGFNAGWYQQWLMLFSNGGTYNLINNGLMFRPEASIGWTIVGNWTMELGVFYQSPVYPVYDGYEGWGLFLKVI